MAALIAVIVVSACQSDAPEEVAPGTFDPGLVERQRAQCEESGGRWGSGGQEGRLVCFLVTPDANASCNSASDCEGLCLARSRTCSPVTPFFGCHEVLNGRGAAQTLCIE